MGEGRHRRVQPAGEQFARPIYDAIRDLEVEYDVYVHLDITATGRRGVLEVRALVYDQSLSKEDRPICACARDWPNAEATSLPGLMFAVMNSLAVQVRDHRMDELLRTREQLKLYPPGRPVRKA